MSGETLLINVVVSLTKDGVKSDSADDNKVPSDSAVLLLMRPFATEMISLAC